MFGHKMKLMCFALTTCVFQLQFLGCTSGFAREAIRGFTQTFGRAVGTSFGTQVGGFNVLGLLGM